MLQLKPSFPPFYEMINSAKSIKKIGLKKGMPFDSQVQFKTWWKYHFLRSNQFSLNLDLSIFCRPVYFHTNIFTIISVYLVCKNTQALLYNHHSLKMPNISHHSRNKKWLWKLYKQKKEKGKVAKERNKWADIQKEKKIWKIQELKQGSQFSEMQKHSLQIKLLKILLRIFIAILFTRRERQEQIFYVIYKYFSISRVEK